MAPSVSPKATASLQTLINDTTEGKNAKFPGAIFHIADDKDNPIFSHASGGSVSLSADTMLMVHSISKIIGAIAFMQLVEKNLVSLDDPSVIEKHLPELAAKKVLTGYDSDGKAVLVDRVGDITPKMLMNHTYGGGHSYFNAELLEYLKEGWDKRNEGSDPHQSILDSPLLWQPGTHTNYGCGFDWLAVLIERLTNRALVDLFQETIFDPLELKGTGWEETYGGDITSRPSTKGRFWPRYLKQPTGEYIAIDPPILEKVERPLAFPEGKYHTYPLGTGLITSPADIARILTILHPINAGVDPITGSRILTSESVTQITTPQLPEHLRNDSRLVPGAIPTLMIAGDLQSPTMDPEGSYGFGCGVQGAQRNIGTGKKGRSKGTVYWYGAANMEYWVDFEKGITAVLIGNFWPWNEPGWRSFVDEVEGLVYEGLGEG